MTNYPKLLSVPFYALKKKLIVKLHYIFPSDCVPESLFSSRAEHQVDMQRKLAEDPLVFLRKREIDQKRKLMENPIKMKQLKAYVS